LWNSAMHGYRDEAVLYDSTFQPYGQVFIMNADGSNKRQITDSPWEDSTPQYVPTR
jgi:Tol biopolymer transport system component